MKGEKKGFRLAHILTTLFFFLSASVAHAQGDGPRAFQIVPDGTKILSLYFFTNHGNQSADDQTVIRGSKIDLNLGAVMYVHTFAVAKRQWAVFGILPFGDATGKVNLPVGYLSSGGTGVGDLQIGGVFGILGSPALRGHEFAEYDPGYALGVLLRVFLPTGEYDPARPVNLGANRWSFQIGAPMSYYLGKSFLDPNLTTFELQPSVTFHTSNNEPFGANTRSQDPMLKIEGHITRNLVKRLQLSLDALYVYGGGTTTDGIGADDQQNALSLGGTAGVSVTRKAMLKVSYGQVAARGDDGPDGWGIRAIGSYAF